MIQVYLRSRRFGSKTGQGLLEYVMAIVLIGIIFGVMQRSMVQGIANLWKTLARDIVAACPVEIGGREGCEMPEQLR